MPKIDGSAVINAIKLTEQADNPATPASGNLLLYAKTNGVYAKDDGGNVVGPFSTGGGGSSILPTLTPPVFGDFAWINQGSAIADGDHSDVFLQADTNAAVQWRILKKAAPVSTPWTLTAAFQPMIYAVNYNRCGLCFRQASDGKLVTVAYMINGSTPGLWSEKWTDAATYSGLYFQDHYIGASRELVWLQLSDTGTDRVVRWGTDGYHWNVEHTVGRTDFLTATEVGILCASHNSTYPAGMRLVHWSMA